MNLLKALFEEVDKLNLPARIVIEPQLSPNYIALFDRLSNDKLLIGYDDRGLSWSEPTNASGFQGQVHSRQGPMIGGLALNEVLLKIESWVGNRANAT